MEKRSDQNQDILIFDSNFNPGKNSVVSDEAVS